MRIYKSKVDVWLIALIGGILILPLIMSKLLGGPAWPGGLICGSVALLFGWLYVATQYRVTETDLIIHAGLYKINIPINSIQSVTESRDVIASPALSLDRLEIKYGDTKTILISPKEKAGFLADIGWPKKPLV